MVLFPLVQTPQIQAQTGTVLPPAVDALVKAKDWPRLADLFETLTPQERGRHYETWIQALNRARRWERLVEVCEALMPQIEAKSGARLGTYRLYRAQGLSQLGRHAEAMTAHAENAALGYPDALVSACAEARLLQDWASMEAYADSLLATNPKHPEGLAWKGEALARRGDHERAEPLLRAALDVDPGRPHTWSNLALCLNHRKAWTEAEAALNKALEADPQLFEARYNRGRTYFELQRYQQAADDFKAALTLVPGDAVLQENLRQAERYLGAEAKGKSQPRKR